MAAKKRPTPRRAKAKKRPSTNVRANHGTDGKFLPGNQCSKGNPLVGRIAQWRALLAKTLTDDDVVGVVQQLRAAALSGQPWAIAEFLNRTLGKVGPYVAGDDTDTDAIGAELLGHLRRAHEALGLSFEEHI